jgi:hypothetical protein
MDRDSNSSGHTPSQQRPGFRHIDHEAVVAPRGCLDRFFDRYIAGRVSLPGTLKVRSGDRRAIRQRWRNHKSGLVRTPWITAPGAGQGTRTLFNQYVGRGNRICNPFVLLIRLLEFRPAKIQAQ